MELYMVLKGGNIHGWLEEFMFEDLRVSEGMKFQKQLWNMILDFRLFK